MCATYSNDLYCPAFAVYHTTEFNTTQIAGPAADTLYSLVLAQIGFLQPTPKIELHAHVNGTIPFLLLQELATERFSTPSLTRPFARRSTRYAQVPRSRISMISWIYALTPAPLTVVHAADALATFFGGDRAKCAYPTMGPRNRARRARSLSTYVRGVNCQSS